MCVANDLHLHLIQPLGFELSDKYLKRSGLDYWQYIKYTVYENWEDFMLRHPEKGEARRQDPPSIWYLTTKSEQSYWDVKFTEGDFLVFGPETKGLPIELMQQDWSRAITVPMFGEHARSLNLASTVQTVAYEAMRQIAPSRKTLSSPSM
jgi:tRNA (cytidine/uridine-2'-O-)-methyltransferase